MSPTAQAEALFATPNLEVIFLSPDLAEAADKAILGSPKFYQTEYGEAPTPGFVQDLLEAPPPPGLSKAAVFPIGLREKGKTEFVGLAHFLLGHPTETTVFVGLMVVAEAFQRKGYGRQFIEGLYNWARPQGIGFMRIRVHPLNEAAQKFLDKLGFADLPNKLSTGHQVWERKLPAVED